MMMMMMTTMLMLLMILMAIMMMSRVTQYLLGLCMHSGAHIPHTHTKPNKTNQPTLNPGSFENPRKTDLRGERACQHPVGGAISQTQNKWVMFFYTYESKKQKKSRGASQLKEMLSWLAFCFYDKHHRLSVTQRPQSYVNWTPKRKIINNYRSLHPVWIINHLKELVDPGAGGDCTVFSKKGVLSFNQHWEYWWNDLMSALCFKIIWREGKLGLLSEIQGQAELKDGMFGWPLFMLKFFRKFQFNKKGRKI